MVNCSEIDAWGNPNIFQCTYGCCGSSSFVYCCSSNGNSYVPKTWQPDLPGYAIAAVTAGCILGLIVLAGVVYALCRQAKRKDKFLEQTIARLRVPPARATRHINATSKMYPGPRRDVISLPTYHPRDRPHLTSTPISSPVDVDPVPKPARPRRFGFKQRGTKNQPTKKKDSGATSGNNRNSEAKPRKPNPVKNIKASGKTDVTEKVNVSTKKVPEKDTNMKRKRKTDTFKEKNVK